MMNFPIGFLRWIFKMAWFPSIFCFFSQKQHIFLPPTKTHPSDGLLPSEFSGFGLAYFFWWQYVNPMVRWLPAIDVTKIDSTNQTYPFTWKTFIINFNLGEDLRNSGRLEDVWVLLDMSFWLRVEVFRDKLSSSFWRKGHWKMERATWGILMEILLSFLKSQYIL